MSGHGFERCRRRARRQAYEDKADLIDAIDGLLGPELHDGNAAIVIARQQILEALRARFEERGIDVAAALERDQYIALDAAQTLSQFMVDGRPDRHLFMETAVNLIRRASQLRREVHVFGEMVALLWEAGNKTGTIRLEQFWNELGKSESFSLLCAYPKQAFGAEGDLRSLLDICREHSHVISAGDSGDGRAPAFENGHGLIDLIRRKAARIAVPEAETSLEVAGGASQAICGST